MSSPAIRSVLALALLCAPGGGQAEGVLDAIVLPLSEPASAQVSVAVTPGLTRTASLPTEGLRQARRDMLAGVEVADADLRALADRWDGLAAQRLVRRLLAQVPRGSDSDVAFYATVAVSTGRVWTLPEAVEAMRRLDPATEPLERVNAYIAMLYPHAWAGNGLALDAVIDLNGEGRLFGPLSDATRARILEAGAGDGRAALRLAVAAMEAGDTTPEGRARVRAELTRALAGSDLGVRAMAANLLALLPAEGS